MLHDKQKEAILKFLQGRDDTELTATIACKARHDEVLCTRLCLLKSSGSVQLQ